MIQGHVDEQGVPIVFLEIAGKRLRAIVDTGFNGDLELPESIRSATSPRFIGRTRSLLAGGQLIEEDSYLVEIPFDGQDVVAEATFVTSDEILIGTRLLESHRLTVDFPRHSVVIEQATGKV